MQCTLRHSGYRLGIPYTKSGEMTYPVQTINLVGGVQYDLTTTIAGAHEIYNILPDYGGADANINVTWVIIGGIWHVYFNSTDSLSGVKIKILYK
jgi:hypothetical protein